MTWVKVDDQMPEHPKVVGLSDKAFRSNVEGWCYASRYLTDGELPKAWVGRRAARDLIGAGLWHEGHGCGSADENGRPFCISGSGEGYVIHDFLRYNPSHDERASERERKRAAGRASVQARAQQAAEQDSEQAVGQSDERPGLGGRVGVGVGLEGGSGGEPPGFAAFYAAYPRHEKRRKAAQAFAAALKRDDFDAILAGAQRYCDDPNRKPQFTSLPASWLNGDGWLDEPLPAESQNSLRHHDRAAEIMGEVQRESGRGQGNIGAPVRSLPA
jgi:hypothetical protein